MNRPFLLITLIFLIFFGCEKDSELYTTIDLEQFKIRTPKDLKNITQQEYDSKVGMISNGKGELSYDYGWHSYNFDNETSDTHTRTNTTIDGKEALIVQPKKKGDGIIGVYIEGDEQTKFNLYGESIKVEETVLKIFHSVQNNQTTPNPKKYQRLLS